jgi:hypothetical protein
VKTRERMQLKNEFMALAKLEPRLLPLLADIKKAKRASRGKNRVCAISLWIGNGGDYSFKDRLCELVGWGRGKSHKPSKKKVDRSKLDFSISDIDFDKPLPPLPPGPLYTSEAYDVAYGYLYCHLPDCKRCMCFGVAA